MRHLPNPHRGHGLHWDEEFSADGVVADPAAAQALYARCPVAETAPCIDATELARALGIGRLWLQDERTRMGLGSFKALGAAHAIARLADAAVGPDADVDTMATALAGTTFVCASAGNHGLSVAAAAPVFGARAVIHLAHTVPAAFAERLQARGAQVVRSGADYDAAMAAARSDADAREWTLLSDSSWPGYVELPRRVMEGYLISMAEAADALASPPSHVFVQCGVGGLAAAVAAFVRGRWGDGPTVVVVEPAAAPAVFESVAAGRPVTTSGPVSSMGRLDCKDPSHLALARLARDADHVVTITDDECRATVDLLARHGLATTPSGAAGVSGVHHAHAHRDALGLSGDSTVLALLTEGPEDGT